MATDKAYDDVQLDVNFTQASTRANLVSEENISISFGKLSKWYEALVPTGGSSGQILGWNSSGTAKWINNTHSLSITAAASGDTSSISLSPNTKYKLTAGGSDFIFTSPNHVSVTKSADTTSTGSPDHGESFTTVDSVTRDTWGHVTKINTKTVTLPDQYVHPGKTQTDTTSTASPAHGGTFTVVDSVTRDTSGHVSGINVKTVTLPADENTDIKVNVTLATTTKAYLLATSTTPTGTAQAVTSVADTGVYLGTTAGMLCVNGTICANSANSNTAGGISLYSSDPETYGIMFRGTTNSGKHGYVQSDWATYFTMNQGATTRGWIFRKKTDGPVASISGAGNAVFNGSITVGGNTTNTSGCRMVYTSSTQTLDFVFV